MQGQLLSPSVTVVVGLAGPRSLYYWGWVPGFVPGLCLCSIMVEIAMVYYKSLSLDYCQWMVQQQLIGGNVEVMVVFHSVVCCGSGKRPTLS